MTDTPLYIVTGATGGIGRAIVAALSTSPCRIVMAVRSPRRALDFAATLPSPAAEITAMELDLASLASVRRFASEFAATGLGIDGLINNAGTMPGKIVMTADGFESATQVNYLATRLLTEQLLPSIKPGGAIVFTTSVTRKIARRRPDWIAHAATFRGPLRRFITYGRTKLMTVRYMNSLAARVSDRGIRVNCADPGIADTGMITLGHPLVDRLSNLLFRPLIYSAARAARAALKALSSPTSGHIYTP